MSRVPALDIDLLRTFVLIADGASFTRAAQRIGRTQSAVTLQVQRLESLVGHRLFERSRGGAARLTPRGELLLEQARTMTALNDDIVLRLRDDRGVAASGQSLPSHAKPVAMVERFANLGGNPADDYFVSGVSSAIADGLSHFGWLLVIQSDGTLPRRDPTGSGSGYLLRGQVRRAARHLRVGAELLDASGTLIWADRYDGRMDDTFELEDRIIEAIAAAIEPKLRQAEITRARRRRSASLDAYDLYLRALPHTYAHMPQGTEFAIPLLERALELDPDYAAAHALAAWCYEWRYTRGGFDEANRGRSLFHAGAALALDSDDAGALAIAGFVTSLLSDERQRGLYAMKRAVALSPSSTTVLYLASHAHAIGGEIEFARSAADRALRLSPLDPLAFEANLALGDIAMLDERFADAAACFGRAAAINPGYSTARFFRAMALARDGRADAAAPFVRQGLDLEPGFNSRIVHEVGMAPEMAARFLAGATALGLPT